jgi:hypothetical protein
MYLGRLATTTLTVYSHMSRRGRGREDVYLHMQANMAKLLLLLWYAAAAGQHSVTPAACVTRVCGITSVTGRAVSSPCSSLPAVVAVGHTGARLVGRRKRDMVGGGGWGVLWGEQGAPCAAAAAAGLLLCWGHLCCWAPAAPLLALLCCHPVCMAAQPTLLQLLVRPCFLVRVC